MKNSLEARIIAILDDAGYSLLEIKKGIVYADQVGFNDDDDAYALTLSKILLTESQLADGERVSVDVGVL
jgi:hypothetical protein